MVRRCRSISDNVNGSRPLNGAAGSDGILAFSDEIDLEGGELRFRDDDDDDEADEVEEADEEVGGATEDNDNGS